MAYTKDISVEEAKRRDKLTRRPVEEQPVSMISSTPPEQPVSMIAAQGTSFQDTNLFVDPNTAALFETGLQRGDVSASFIQPQETRAAEIERRAGVLQTGIQATGRAAILEGSIQARRAFQRQGKALSSAVVFGEGGLLDVSEAAKARGEAAFAQGLGTIYAQVGQEFGQREALGAGIFIAGLDARTQRDITDVRTASDEAIAQINADTALSIEEKRRLTQEATNKSNEAIAQINYRRGITGVVDTREFIDGKDNPNYMMPVGLAIQAGDQAFNTVSDPNSPYYGMQDWAVGYEIDILKNINPETGNPFYFDEAMAKIDQGYYVADLNSEDGWRQFNATLQFQADTFNISEANKMAMFVKTMEFNIREQNIGIAEFAETLSWAKQEAWWNDDLKRDLALMRLNETARMHKIDTINGFTQWSGGINADLLALGIATDEEHWYRLQMLKQQAPLIQNTLLNGLVNRAISLMEDPTFGPLMTGAMFEFNADGSLATDEDGNYIYETDEDGNIIYDTAQQDWFIGILWQGIEDTFFEVTEAGETGLIETVDMEGGAQYRSGDITDILADNLGLPEGEYATIGDIVSALLDGKTISEFVKDITKEPFDDDDFTPDVSDNTPPEDPGDTSTTIGDDIKDVAGPPPDVGDMDPGEVTVTPGSSGKGKFSNFKWPTLTRSQQNEKAELSKLLRDANLTFRSLPTHFQRQFMDAIIGPDINERMNGRAAIVFYIDRVKG